MSVRSIDGWGMIGQYDKYTLLMKISKKAWFKHSKIEQTPRFDPHSPSPSLPLCCCIGVHQQEWLMLMSLHPFFYACPILLFGWWLCRLYTPLFVIWHGDLLLIFKNSISKIHRVKYIIFYCNMAFIVYCYVKDKGTDLDSLLKPVLISSSNSGQWAFIYGKRAEK